MRKIASLLALFPLFFISIPFAQAQEVLTPEPVVIMFGRDDCGFCKEQFKYLYNEDITYEYLNIVKDDQAKALYDQLAEKHDISKVTPVTVVGETVLVGFNGEQTTGKAIKDAIERAKYTDIRTIEDHLARAPKQDVVVGGGCSGLNVILTPVNLCLIYHFWEW